MTPASRKRPTAHAPMRLFDQRVEPDRQPRKWCDHRTSIDSTTRIDNSASPGRLAADSARHVRVGTRWYMPALGGFPLARGMRGLVPVKGHDNRSRLAETRSAVVTLLHSYAAQRNFPAGVKLHVSAVRVPVSDAHFAVATVGLTGGNYGGGQGDTALVVAMEVDGSWSIVAGPGHFPCSHSRPTAKVVLELVCSKSPA